MLPLHTGQTPNDVTAPLEINPMPNVPLLVGILPPVILLLSELLPSLCARHAPLPSPFATRRMPIHVYVEGTAFACLFHVKLLAAPNAPGSLAHTELILLFWELGGMSCPRSHPFTLALVAICWLGQMPPLPACVCALLLAQLAVAHWCYMRCWAGLPPFTDSTATSFLHYSLLLVYYGSHAVYARHPLLPHPDLPALLDAALACTTAFLQILVIVYIDCRTAAAAQEAYEMEAIDARV